MKQMQPQDKAIHDMLQAQSKELRQFLNSLEKKDSLQNICFMRTQDQVNQNTVNICGLQESIKRIEQQMNSQTTKKLEQKINALEENMEQLKKLIEKPQINTQNLQISEFYQATEQIYQTNISDQNYSQSQFEFIVEDDESPFSIGIIQGGDLENQDSKVKFLQIQFPSGQLIRGAEDPINFLPRQFLRNDRVQMKVLKEKELFMVTLNGVDIPPIKIKEELFNYHAFVIKSEYPLQDIISQDSEY